MSELKLNITLSNIFSLLSNELRKLIERIGVRLRRIMKMVVAYLLMQIQFLVKFKYTKENIKNHLLAKAANFFGFDFSEDKVKKKRGGKPNKRSFRLINRKNVSRKKESSFVGFTKKRKKGKKSENNFYRPPG